MKLTAVILALCAMCASAFVAPTSVVRTGSFAAPVRPAVSASNTNMKMGLESIADVLPAIPEEAHNQMAELSNNLLLAASTSDFGGYTGPAIGLLTVGALIVVLSPPLADS
ncbi:unnamed protein product [Choristocarpus tenellus]